MSQVNFHFETIIESTILPLNEEKPAAFLNCVVKNELLIRLCIKGALSIWNNHQNNLRELSSR